MRDSNIITDIDGEVKNIRACSSRQNWKPRRGRKGLVKRKYGPKKVENK